MKIVNYKLSIVTNKAIDRILVTNYTKITSRRDRLREYSITKILKKLIIKTYN